jgi:glucose-6-phosphate 1-dehydrogenase
VEEAWRIVDRVLKADTPLHDYDPGTWGPEAAVQQLAPPGGWLAPTVA